MSDVVLQAQAAKEAMKHRCNPETVVSLMPENMQHNDFAVWECVFEDEPEIWKHIWLEEHRRLAKSSYDDFVSDGSHPCVLKVIGMTCLSSIEHAQPKFKNEDGTCFKLDLRQETYETWLQAFSSHRNAFIENVKLANNMHRKYFPEDAEEIDKIL